MTYKTLMAAAVLATLALPAYADTDNGVTLVIENDAGSVTTQPGMTQRECDAAVGLLSARKPSGGWTVSGSLLLSNGTTYCGSMSGCGGVSTPSPQAHTSVITSAKCMVPAEKKQ